MYSMFFLENFEYGKKVKKQAKFFKKSPSRTQTLGF